MSGALYQKTIYGGLGWPENIGNSDHSSVIRDQLRVVAGSFFISDLTQKQPVFDPKDKKKVLGNFKVEASFVSALVMRAFDINASSGDTCRILSSVKRNEGK